MPEVVVQIDYNLGFCTTLYKLEWLFPTSPSEAYIFYGVLLAFSLLIILYIVLGFRRQRQLLSNGQITKMKEWLLPVYYRFLFFFVAIYGCKAIDIIVIYLAFKGQYECTMPRSIAFVHAASFWTSEFWLLDVLFFFLASNSHGIAAIRRSFWLATFVWICNAIVITIGIEDCSNGGFAFYVGVYGFQLALIVVLMVYMCLKSYPHHRHIWVALTMFFLITLFRFVSDLLRLYRYDGFCFMDIADYMSSVIMPWLIIYTLRKDSKHWSTLSTWMQAANRGSIYNTFSLHVDGHERQSMTVWSELLSQHTKILKSESLTPIEGNKKVIGGSGSVTKARYKGSIVAVKEWRFEHFTKHVIALWCKEALISSNFRHRNVVKLIGICIEPPSIKIVMEWCRHGALRRLLTSRRALPWSLRFQLLLDVAEGMAHLHRNGLVHRDLKTLNLLVDEDHHGHYVIRICDFGSSRSVDLDEYYDKYQAYYKQQNKKHGKNNSHSKSRNNNHSNNDQSILSFASTASAFTTTDTMTTMTTITAANLHKNIMNPHRYNANNNYNKGNLGRSGNYNGAVAPLHPSTPISHMSTSGGRNNDTSANYSNSNGNDHSQSVFEKLKSKFKLFASNDDMNGDGDSRHKNTSGSISNFPGEHIHTHTHTHTHTQTHTNRNASRHKPEPSQSGHDVESQTQDDYMQYLQDMSITSQILHSVASPMSTIVGSVQFLAPEILENIEFKPGSRSAKSKQNSVYGFSADVYSYGCVIWEMITRREIYKGKSYADIQKFVLSNKRPIVMESELNACPDSTFLLRLMDQCWQQDPQTRPNFNQIISMLEEKKDKFIPPPSVLG